MLQPHVIRLGGVVGSILLTLVVVSRQSSLSVSAFHQHSLLSATRRDTKIQTVTSTALSSSSSSSSSSSIPATIPAAPVTTLDRRLAITTLLKSTTAVAASTTFGSVLLIPSTANAATSTKTTSNTKKSASSSIASRLRADSLTMPSASSASELSSGVDNLYYPPWLLGKWNVTQTLKSTATPLGLQFIGGPNGDLSIATESYEQQRRELNKPISFQLRYVMTQIPGTIGGGGPCVVVEDRAFNTRQRLDSFAGRKVVSSVEYADVGGSNRGAVLAAGGGVDDPLQTTVVRFKGPAAQKTFVLGHGVDEEEDAGSGSSSGGGDGVKGGNKWAGYEVDRNIFMLTNQNTAPPITTDSELIWSFERSLKDEDVVLGRLRIASYLNAQADQLFFQAKNRAVSLADYDLTLRKVPDV